MELDPEHHNIIREIVDRMSGKTDELSEMGKSIDVYFGVLKDYEYKEEGRSPQQINLYIDAITLFIGRMGALQVVLARELIESNMWLSLLLTKAGMGDLEEGSELRDIISGGNGQDPDLADNEKRE